MPLIRVDLLKGRSEKEIQGILDEIHKAVLAAFKVPEDDRYQIVTQHDSYEMVIKDTGLGIPRSDKVVVISVTSRERTEEAIKKFYLTVMENLQDAHLVDPDDLMINVTFNEAFGWSFARGKIF